MHDPYEDQLAAARYRAERDQAREELARIREDRSWDARADAGMLGAKEDRRAVEWVREHGGLDAVEQRIMPEGMEWPRFEDDATVRIGDEISWRDEGGVVNSIELQDGGYFILHAADGAEDWIHPQYFPGERVKRPAPKVLDADGVEIRVGDTVYLLPGDWCDKFPCCGYHGNEELEVFSLHAGHVEGGVGCRDTRRPKGACYPQPSKLTHRAPVLAADGEPLREGEHVWHVETGTELVVKELPKPGEYQAVVVFAPPASHLTSFDPDQLTHERPDSWERLAEDVANASCPDVYCANHHIDASDTSYEWAMARDIVRRARALAERGK